MKNYHTHTYRCKHAQGDVIDYATVAQEQGVTVLGISDHTPLPDNRWSIIRMGMDELPDYLKSIDDAQKAFPEMQILKGLECEYAPEYHSFYKDELLGQYKLDYLIGGTHLFWYDGRWIDVYGNVTGKNELQAYTRCVVDSIESGLFSFIAHPDLFGTTYLTWDKETEACSKEIAAAAVAYDVPLEINGYGFRKPFVNAPDGRRRMYPWEPFWEVVAKMGAPVIANSDAHLPQDVVGNLDDCQEIIDKFCLLEKTLHI